VLETLFILLFVFSIVVTFKMQRNQVFKTKELTALYFFLNLTIVRKYLRIDILVRTLLFLDCVTDVGVW
jgi:hypothetical protein